MGPKRKLLDTKSTAKRSKVEVSSKQEVTMFEPLTRLPPEIIRKIFLYLRNEDLFLGCSLVSRSWNKFLWSNLFWEGLIIREFGPKGAKTFLQIDGALQGLKEDLVANPGYCFDLKDLNWQTAASVYGSSATLSDFLNTVTLHRPSFFQSNSETDFIKSENASWYIWKVPTKCFQVLDVLKPPIIAPPGMFSLKSPSLYLLDSNKNILATLLQQVYQGDKMPAIRDYPSGVRYICCSSRDLFRIVMPSLIDILQVSYQLLSVITSDFPIFEETIESFFEKDPGLFNYSRIKPKRLFHTAIGKLLMFDPPETVKTLNAIFKLGVVHASPALLEKVVSYNHVGALKLFLEHAVTKDFKGSDGRSLLFHALDACNACKRVATHLLCRGLDINESDSEGNTILMKVARKYNDFETLRYVIKKGGDPNRLNKKKQSALQSYLDNSIKLGPRVIVELLAAGANPNVKFVYDNAKSTALIQAVKKCRIDIAKVLIDGGADVNMKDSEGHVALDYVKPETKGRRLETVQEFQALLKNESK